MRTLWKCSKTQKKKLNVMKLVILSGVWLVKFHHSCVEISSVFG